MSPPPTIDTTEEIFEDSLLSLFQHRPIAFSTKGPEDPYVYLPSGIQLLRRASVENKDGKENSKDDNDNGSMPLQLPPLKQQPAIKLNLPTAPPALHTTLQLSHLWLSSIFLADLISHHLITVNRERICELGAGAGLPGIVSALNGAKEVVATDYAVPLQQGREEGVLDVLRSNFLRTVPRAAEEEGNTWAVLGHTWGDGESVRRVLSSPLNSNSNSHTEAESGKFTLLLLADLLWSTASHSALITSLERLMDPQKGRACVVAGLHQGRGPVERFICSWKAAGGWLRYEMEVQWGPEGWELLEDFRGTVDDGKWEYLYDEARNGGDEHGTVVYFTIGLENPR
ncbi:hypothetical protein QFC22_000061 [Naganishia vaughanmartiniae]|uniref:Uncharacterized protein n=1 Tax=Naganishia vaughanmartiniae TaxID=1424756 RepID=A0ACC2XM91_9TREE|nr:hypothetical protein QFC22_000061 [Naganishia vaughanmartiniae]